MIEFKNEIISPIAFHQIGASNKGVYETEMVDIKMKRKNNLEEKFYEN